ncbi:G-protein complex alpha subunit GpaA/FadA [Flagelloscypha sp. PMI_526]|nr:G-protein complex alpha subunit GpaA/FadA [Flagelloscypha sp. PMI_526]
MRCQYVDEILNIGVSPSSNKHKVLLLGASQSGKSTVLKQLKLLYLSKTTQKEYESYRETIFSVLLFEINAILDVLPQLGLELLEKHRREAADIQAYWRQIIRSWDFLVPQDIFDGLSNVLSDPAVKAAIVRSNEFQLTDTARYFFDSLDRISAPNYTPTDQDILRSYLKTTGITQTTFLVGKSVWEIHDVGGTRAERKKWIHCFDNVDAIIFVAAISEYDQMLYEDDSVNRLQETLVLWDSICNSKWFARTSVILFLNKFDVLASKISKVPMGNYFLDYTGGSDYRLACDYILNRFLKSKPKGKTIFTHFTCATDTNHMCSKC